MVAPPLSPLGVAQLSALPRLFLLILVCVGLGLMEKVTEHRCQLGGSLFLFHRVLFLLQWVVNDGDATVVMVFLPLCGLLVLVFQSQIWYSWLCCSFSFQLCWRRWLCISVLWLLINGSRSLVSLSSKLLLPFWRTDRTVKLERAIYLFVLQQVVGGCICYCVGS
jgi:hypothetical protein